MGKLKSGVKSLRQSNNSKKLNHEVTKLATSWFIADANVLIDYVQTSPDILGMVSKFAGPVHIEAAILDEVKQLDLEKCKAIGLIVVHANLTQFVQASARGGALSFEDKLCLIMARDNGWTCLSNDGPLRSACVAQGVKVVWGLEIMVTLVSKRYLHPQRAIEVAKSIQAVNPIYITKGIIDNFCRKIESVS